MNLHEYQSKGIFAQYGIPVPSGKVAATPAEAKAIAQEIGGRVVVKSQVLTGGRGKAGGIKLASTPEEAEQLAQQILSMTIKGLPVRKVLIDPASNIKTEIYLGITNDRAARKPVLMASAAGGVDIEEVARTTPEKIIRTHIDPLMGLRDYQARDVAIEMELPREQWAQFIHISRKLWEVYRDNDATLAEINPLVITGDGKLVALDGKMSIDDNALAVGRHPKLEEMRDLDVEEASEIEAKQHELSYIKLDGNIGCMVNGAGLAMTTMDVIKLFGGSPANFLDIGGGAGPDKVAAAFRIILKEPNVKAILINIFGGITRCDDVARGILTAMSEVGVHVPMVVRLVGTNAKEGRELLANANMGTAETLTDAAQKVVAAAKGG
ncbi:MAG TPA: ADP-forming succinate--CoA ligase subunit beta [Anaerolineales bacterium]|nr:ADP-forming succinate--CoA ligase subunit beta [Anaerolineales bacterium]